MKLEVRVVNKSMDERYLADIARISTGKSDFCHDFPHYNLDDNLRLVRALYKAGHMSIFEFVNIIYLIDAPLFVRDQLIRYRCASYNARSLRRCEPLKIENPETEGEQFYNEVALPFYQRAIDNGVKKEVARNYLTSCAPTQWVVNYNARELFHIFDQRLSPHAQNETRTIVEKMFEEFKYHFPVLAECWSWNGGNKCD